MSSGDGLVDTIAAIATPPGVGAISLVRLSGPAAVRIATELIPGLPRPPVPRRPTVARVRDPADGSPLDRALVTFFAGPNSFTGEDVVEISCHGGWLAPRLVLDAALQAGARQAAPGEFTRRAYLHGRLDLVQAEAIADLVEGSSPALHRTALHQLERGLSDRLSRLREAMIRIEALLVHHIDFPEEDDAPVPLETIAAEADSVEDRLDRLLATAPEGELLREGALAVLAGRPNTGKSSLFNALVGEERAIVTATPGTTRDAIETLVSFEGLPFRLVDTAGMRTAEEEVEALGIEVARRYLAHADVVLFCAEAGRPLEATELEFLQDAVVPVVLVRTQRDRREAPDEVASDTETGPPVAAEIELSARTGEGLAELRSRLPELVYEGLVSQRMAGGAAREQGALLTRRRQSRGVKRARDEVRAFASAVRSGVPVEVASAHIGPAKTALEEVLGVISREEVLDRLFETFCIGK